MSGECDRCGEHCVDCACAERLQTAASGISDAEMVAAIKVGRAMLKGMRATKLPRDAQVRAAIHALIAIGSAPQ